MDYRIGTLQEVHHLWAQSTEKTVLRFEKPPRPRIIRALCDLERLRGTSESAYDRRQCASYRTRAA